MLALRLARRSLLRPGRRTLATLTRPEEHDIVCVGGGPVGLALVAALAAHPAIAATHKITLIEASQLDKVAAWELPSSEYSNRVSSVTASNAAFLQDIGVWPNVDLARTRSIEEMQVWDGISAARITFNAPYKTPDPFDEPSTSSSLFPEIEPMATLVENLNLQRGLLQTLKAHGQGESGVEILDGVKVLGIVPGEGGWPVLTIEGKRGSSPRSIRARLLIGADGYNSPVRTYSEIDTFGWAYNAHGVVGSVRVDVANMGDGMTTAWQRFLPEGPIAFLPMSDTVASLVWSTTPAIAAALKKLPIELLPVLVNAAFALPYKTLTPIFSLLTSSPPASELEIATALQMLPQPHSEQEYDLNTPPPALPPTIIGIQPASVASFPLRLSHADSYLGMPKGGLDLRTVLVGDAAHTVHPMAGQGMNMGLGDVRALVDTLAKAVADGGDVGSYNSLRTYPRSRYIANHAVLSTTDHLSTLYSSQSPLIVWARSTGLEIINELDSVKSAIMGGAGGSKATSGGPWGIVAGALESVGQTVGMAKSVGGLVGSQVKSRLASLLKV